MIVEDLNKVKEEAKKGCVTFLKYINENYIPAERKLTLTDDMLSEDKMVCKTFCICWTIS